MNSLISDSMKCPLSVLCLFSLCKNFIFSPWNLQSLSTIDLMKLFMWRCTSTSNTCYTLYKIFEVLQPDQMELLGMHSTPSFLLLPSLLWFRLVAPDRTVWHFNWVQANDMLNLIVWNRTVWLFTCVQTNDWCLIELLVIQSNTWNHLTLLT